MLPDKDHPVWKVAQGLVAVLGLIVLTHHGLSDGLTTPDLDAAGGTGLVAVAVGFFLRSIKA